ncbi:MAG: helix-turn-helix transcriptional regulator [Saprospiraceae bacterium]|nr:helix-turn-helix transcriptional regulator [Candidatus Vicinibacter affinis]
MSPSSNYLRMYRKKSPLTQSDMGFLVGIKDISNISRYEKGQRQPTIEFLLNYHHIFEISIETFFEPQSELVKGQLTERIQMLILEIKKSNNTLKNTSRIKFLEQIIIRLTNYINQ